MSIPQECFIQIAYGLVMRGWIAVEELPEADGIRHRVATRDPALLASIHASKSNFVTPSSGMHAHTQTDRQTDTHTHTQAHVHICTPPTNTK